MSNFVKRTLFKIARSPIAGAFIGFSFAYLTSLMPLDKLMNSSKVILFHHPVPTWKTHVLGVPKKRMSSFIGLDLEDKGTKELILAVYAGLQQTAVSLQLDQFSIIVNGGEYQDVPQIHFHLLSGMSKHGNRPGQEECVEVGGETAVIHSKPDKQTIAYPHPNSSSNFHYLITTKITAPSFLNINFKQEASRQQFLTHLSLAQQIINQQQPIAYRLQLNYSQEEPTRPLVFHLMQ